MHAQKLKYTVGLLAVILFATTVLGGCAGIRAASARQAHINAETKNHVYNMPCQQVWPTARQILFAEGYAVKDTGEGSTMTLETEWAYKGQGSSRYLVQGIEPQAGQCKVNFTINSRSQKGNLDSNRDLEIEWELLQKVDQRAAQEIMQEAEMKAQAAANS